MTYTFTPTMAAGLSQMERWNISDPTKFELIGTKDMIENLNRYMEVMPAVVFGELGLWAEKIFQESQKEVPVDMTYTTGKSHRLKGGTLKQSGTIENYDEGGEKGYQIGYFATSGQDQYNYAIRQHEDLTFRHTKPGAKAKYLEDPFNRIKDRVIPGIVQVVGSYFQQGIPSMSALPSRTRIQMGNLLGRFA